jgi:hypothetical protein
MVGLYKLSLELFYMVLLNNSGFEEAQPVLYVYSIAICSENIQNPRQHLGQFCGAPDMFVRSSDLAPWLIVPVHEVPEAIAQNGSCTASVLA